MKTCIFELIYTIYRVKCDLHDTAREKGKNILSWRIASWIFFLLRMLSPTLWNHSPNFWKFKKSVNHKKNVSTVHNIPHTCITWNYYFFRVLSKCQVKHFAYLMTDMEAHICLSMIHFLWRLTNEWREIKIL